MKKILITGTAGFIGHHLALELSKYHHVLGLDNINAYYSPTLKLDRLKSQGFSFVELSDGEILQSSNPHLRFVKCDLTDRKTLNLLFKSNHFDYVVHLAAQAGVRYSISNPETYLDSNIYGFLNILELCKDHQIQHLVYASSSSVYGQSQHAEFKENQSTSKPLSTYAATKKTNELMAHVYASLFKLPVTGLRFFTVYGPWARPDMALHLFCTAMMKGEKIKVFNQGHMERDFTYVDDVVKAISLLLEKTPATDANGAPCQLFNIGNNKPTRLTDFISALESELGMKAQMELLPMQPGDMVKTFANCDALESYINFKPQTSLHHGIKEFVAWYTRYYRF